MIRGGAYASNSSWMYQRLIIRDRIENNRDEGVAIVRYNVSLHYEFLKHRKPLRNVIARWSRPDNRDRRERRSIVHFEPSFFFTRSRACSSKRNVYRGTVKYRFPPVRRCSSLFPRLSIPPPPLLLHKTPNYFWIYLFSLFHLFPPFHGTPQGRDRYEIAIYVGDDNRAIGKHRNAATRSVQ